ncbi:Uncharacterised protein [Serratia rubidaea]|uniref:YebO-like protein n=1 Tax=Serratia rubidaea TaxID=61652 RepID=A0A126VJ37_SERRU|nr:YebO family protein [Serratia rubidaea]AML58105.1 Putative exported protein precursor [Serratia rubidaea]MBD8452679.1 YebO family protein [Serratia rubidaea]MBS0972038.1 YebO family protein [Serratia rubidaea]MCR1000906.1 YebO family protein [Serratia rubidaea]MDK1702753.1 YebO family protein [Serratia rubidaea]
MFDAGFSPSLLSLGIALVALLLGLWVWFLVNRASVRANEQVRLLQEIVEQQQQQTALLKRIARQSRGEALSAGTDDDDLGPAMEFKDFIPER